MSLSWFYGCVVFGLDGFELYMVFLARENRRGTMYFACVPRRRDIKM